MNTRAPVYVAAPYGDPDPQVRDLNADRAELIARLAAREGLAPLVVHSMIHRGVLGDDSDPAQRAAGIGVSLSLLAVIRASVHGQLWVLLRDDGERTDGVLKEIRLWERGTGRAAARRKVTRIGTWDDYAQAFRAVGLGRQWEQSAKLGAALRRGVVCE